MSNDQSGYQPPSSVDNYGVTRASYANPVRGDYDTSKDWMGIVSLITSILGIYLVGIIFGHMGLKAYERGEATNRSLSMAGAVIGWIGMVLGLFGGIAYFMLLNSGTVTVY